jgi:diguanylate cyclase (GGDEF)-like protein/PAS domain S-box-containing protein
VRPDRGASSGANDARVREFAQNWATAIEGRDQTNLTPAQTVDLLAGLTATALTAVKAESFDAAVGARLGATLVRADITSPEALGATVRVFGRGLLAAGQITRPDGHARVADLLARLVEGSGRAVGRQVWRQHKAIQRAASVATTLAQEKQRTSDIRFRTVFNAAAVGIGVVDLTGHVREVNAALARMLGYPPEEIIGESVAELVVPEADPAGWSRFGELLTGARATFRTEAAFLKPDGETVVLDVSMSAVTDNGPRFIIGVAVDITERRRLADRLWREARQDPLTGLPNRRLFFEDLQEILSDDEVQLHSGLLLVDLDGFKNVNDSRGHDVGDRVLAAVAERIVASVPADECLVARLGGDEFAILSRDCAHPGGYLEHASEVVAAFDEPVQAGGEEFTLSASIGAVGYPIVGTTPGEVMRAADLTLYRAKATGRNRWVAYDRDESAPQLSRHTLATELPRAINRNEFSMRYQPMVSLVTGEVTGVEAVVRWRHPGVGLLTPAQFLPLAIESGHIVELSRWVLEVACDQLKAWHDVAPELCMSVNLVPVHLQRPGLAETILSALADRDLPARLLQLELDSAALTGDAPGAVETIRDLVRAGVRVAIDEFGTGQANLAYLSRLPLHGLKIAGALLEPLQPGPNKQNGHEAVLSAIIGMAHALHLSVTAESVDHPYQAARLQALGCDTAQGRLFGRPATPAELTARIAAGPVPPRRRAHRG